jgi:hypothetical protein
MFWLGISRPSPDSYPPVDFGRESPRSALLQLPKGRPSRSRRLLTAPTHGCPRDDSVRRRSKSHHRTVARALIRPRVEANFVRLVSRPDLSTSSSTLARLFARLPARRFELARTLRSCLRRDSFRTRISAQLPARGLGGDPYPVAVARARNRAARDRSRGCPRVISSSGHSLVDHLAVARSMIRVRVAERLR